MGKLAFLFSGQGSQYTGMGKEIFKNFATARNTFEEASDVLSMDIEKLCFEADEKTLTQTKYAQPAIFTVSSAIFKVYMEEIGIAPDFMAGHSLGEITALSCAGAMSFEEGVKLANVRGKLMQEVSIPAAGGMYAVMGLERDIVGEGLLQCKKETEIAVISNINSREQLVISGHLSALENCKTYFETLGAKVIPIKVSAPFHSPFMQPAAEAFYQELANIHFKPLQTKVISNVTGELYPYNCNIPDYLVKQMVQPVEWKQSMDYIESQDTSIVVEIGPKNILTKLMNKNVPYINALETNEIKEFASMSETIKRHKHIPPFVSRCLGIAVSTPNNNWNEEEYETGVVEPYKKLKQLQELLDAQQLTATSEQMDEAVSLLKTIFKYKYTPVAEQEQRLQQLYRDTATTQQFALSNKVVTL